MNNNAAFDFLVGWGEQRHLSAISGIFEGQQSLVVRASLAALE